MFKRATRHPATSTELTTIRGFKSQVLLDDRQGQHEGETGPVGAAVHLQ